MLAPEDLKYSASSRSIQPVNGLLICEMAAVITAIKCLGRVTTIRNRSLPHVTTLLSSLADKNKIDDDAREYLMPVRTNDPGIE